MKPMEGIKVVELSTMLAGPMTARILAEWGADVIKVESMNGDAWREQAGTSLSPRTETANPNFDMQNINKRFLSVNMRTEEGKAAHDEAAGHRRRIFNQLPGAGSDPHGAHLRAA